MNEFKIVLPPSPADPIPWVAILGSVSTLLWMACIVFIVWWIGLDQIRQALTRITKVSVAGLELSFRDELAAAASMRSTKIDAPKFDRLSRRIAASASLTTGSRILWVDDNQAYVKNEVKILEDSGVKLERVTSTEEALQLVAVNVYDLIISDISRDGDNRAGTAMADEIFKSDPYQLLIFYVGQAVQPPPQNSFGIADSPDQLFHLILDALARRRG